VTEAFAFGVAVTIRVTLLLIVVIVLAAILRRRSAALHHAIWTSAVIASLSIPFLTVGLQRFGGATALPISGIASVFTWLTSPMQQRELIEGHAAQSNTRSLRANSLMSATLADVLNGRPTRQRAAKPIEMLVVIWIAVVMILLARIVTAMMTVARLRRRARVATNERIVSIFRDIRNANAANVSLLESDDVTAPATMGIIRPVILLPGDAGEWNATRLRATLAHEYAHVVRRDCITQLAADVARAIYWFNPFVWYARRRMIVDRERACDDRVISEGIRPDKYASVLIDTVRTSLTHRGTIALGALSMARPSELEARLVSILDPRRPRRGMSRRAYLTISVGIASSAILVAGSRVEAAQPLALFEPDLRGDSIANPLSEKLDLSASAVLASRNRAALSGPDSLLARKLFAGLDHVPGWDGDLVRDRSTWALSRQRDGLLVAPLLESLADPDWRVRAYAAWALAEGREARAMPLLLPLLDDPNWRMRAMAANAIASIGEPTAAGAMFRALDDEAWQVRFAAVEYFGSLRDTRYGSALEAATRDRHIAVRSAASDVLKTLTRNHS
jgi:beta-lactamase regulating signal transducer with metallopeptidase domain